MLLKIDKGVAYVERAPSGIIKDTLKALEVGDSFLLPVGSSRTNIYTVAQVIQIRVTIKTEGPAFRVWRIA